MSLLVFGYPLLPAVLSCLSAFILVFLATLRMKTGLKNRLTVVTTLAGSIGFALTFALPFFPPYYHTYLPIVCSFGLMAFLGMFSCLLRNLNPLSIQTPLFPKVTPPINGTTENSLSRRNPFEQTAEEAYQLMDLRLFRLGNPHTYFKQLRVANGREMTEFPFILLNPSGLYLIYPSNWSGEVMFDNVSATRHIHTKEDIPDMITSLQFHEQVLANWLKTSSASKIPMRSIICLTNPSAVITGKPAAYDVLDLGDLAQYFQKKEDAQVLTPKMINQLKEFILHNNH